MKVRIRFFYTDRQGRSWAVTRFCEAFTNEINAVYHWLRWCGYTDVEFREVV